MRTPIDRDRCDACGREGETPARPDEALGEGLGAFHVCGGARVARDSGTPGHVKHGVDVRPNSPELGTKTGKLESNAADAAHVWRSS